MPLYALNLFDLADNDDYRAYTKRSKEAVEKHGGSVVAVGLLNQAIVSDGGEPRRAMVLVEWESREGFDAFRADPELADLHLLRESGTTGYLWWVYDKLDDLRPLFAHHGG